MPETPRPRPNRPVLTAASLRLAPLWLALGLVGPAAPRLEDPLDVLEEAEASLELRPRDHDLLAAASKERNHVVARDARPTLGAGDDGLEAYDDFDVDGGEDVVTPAPQDNNGRRQA
ncbi:MAG: hypothetical protein AAFZ87_14895, partial [Planctomycetota bacterium]